MKKQHITCKIIIFVDKIVIDFLLKSLQWCWFFIQFYGWRMQENSYNGSYLDVEDCCSYLKWCLPFRYFCCENYCLNRKERSFVGCLILCTFVRSLIKWYDLRVNCEWFIILTLLRWYWTMIKYCMFCFYSYRIIIFKSFLYLINVKYWLIIPMNNNFRNKNQGFNLLYIIVLSMAIYLLDEYKLY